MKPKKNRSSSECHATIDALARKGRAVGEVVVASIGVGAAAAAGVASAALPVDSMSLETAVEVLLQECSCW